MENPAVRKPWWRILLGLVLLVVVVVGVHFAVAGFRDRHPDSEVARLAELLRLEPGMTIAEVGAGEGRMTVLVARTVGPDGTVISTELDQDRLEDIRQAVAAAGLDNVRVIEAGKRETNLPPACCDAIFMVKVYHHFTNPAAINASLFEALRPGGRLAVVDFPPNFWMFWAPQPSGVPEDRGGHGMPRGTLIQELTDGGFEIERDIADWWTWPQQRYCVVARKPSGPALGQSGRWSPLAANRLTSTRLRRESDTRRAAGNVIAEENLEGIGCTIVRGYCGAIPRT